MPSESAYPLERKFSPCKADAWKGGSGSGKTILVTGSTGWLGGKLCEALVARGVTVVGLARRDTDIAGVMSVRADLATGAGLEKLQGLEFDCCVHLAAVAGWGALADCLEVNVQGTRRLFDALLAGGCTRFVVASSISTVGTGRGFIDATYLRTGHGGACVHQRRLHRAPRHANDLQ